ncbi:Uncharacterised protein [Mycobacteroides abscessus subsp. massiliense]|uniref:hypothetical protein n=1 Tax=Mycobacteroides abscessus TaxID=36809 RepID=UPI0009C9903B|nr:hypothetical protein [Mycobacteroides abscessus]MBE5502618.1 hypothetical protein [Mycobacteroides abscessus]SKU63956.1 Uncharacterised protein [Mycobacteroides abscessus subsp. massiliense]SLH52888.1 Uncharacterised protein [Mycobacteroides abscessus subsp. massiliense]
MNLAITATDGCPACGQELDGETVFFEGQQVCVRDLASCPICQGLRLVSESVCTQCQCLGVGGSAASRAA